MQAPCEVHDRVFGDPSPREVAYCGLCKVNLCEECRGRYTVRSIAAGLALAEKLGWGSGRLKGDEEAEHAAS